jgi:hypothetical protein
MGEKVGNYRVAKQPGYLYYTKGDPIVIYKTKMQHKGRTKSKQGGTLVLRTKERRANGYLYYVSADGALMRSKMGRR